MKKILILYGSYGGGHLSAANSIANHYKSNYPDVEIKVNKISEYDIIIDTEDSIVAGENTIGHITSSHSVKCTSHISCIVASEITV